MASDGNPTITAAILTQVSQTQISSSIEASGKLLPQGGNATSKAAAASEVTTAKMVPLPAKIVSQPAETVTKPDLPALLAQLNKHLNDSGRPNQFRVDPNSRNQTIQEINPANGEVVGEFAASEFPALARSLGVSGMLIDSHA